MRWGILAIAALFALPASAHAFCGFYVGGADSELYNDATMVVMMRDGTKTVLSMQNDYQGPPEGFALVVPVPEVLGEENVRTLPKSIFERVDQLAAPRLVEYWEQDPCYRPRPERRMRSGASTMNAAPSAAPRRDEATGVTVEAEFAVGEYDIVILSAEESSGLETWLHDNDYNMPDGSGEALDPYVQLGTKFFVAKVDPGRVTFQRGRALLSPLRVHYDAETFALPIRLGLLNARGPQDLLVHILAKNARYEVANYPNVFIPTNLIVKNQTKQRFGDFYRGLFDRVRAENEGTVVTEYSWQANNCDPCPTQPLQPAEIALLGGDVIDGMAVQGQNQQPVARRRPRPGFGGSGGWTLTRLHHRYDANDLTHDLVFRRAEAVIGGRGMPNQEGELTGQHPIRESSVNQFQGRYVILHRWNRPIRCENPVRGRWGGPPGQGGGPFGRVPAASAPSPIREPRPRRARPVDPRRFVTRADHQYLGVTAAPAADSELDYAADPPPAPEPETEEAQPEPEAEEAEPEPEPETEQAEPEPQPAPHAVPVTEDGGCASCATNGRGAAGALLFLGALAMVLRRRR